MALAVSGTFAGQAQAADKTVTLVYAEVNPMDSIVGQTGQKFKEEVERLSGGTVLLDIKANGVLGAEQDVLDAMLGGGGTIDMSRISAFALTSYGGQKSKLLSIPYTFTSRDHFWKFAASDLAPEFLLEPHENGTGIRGLFYGEEGFRHFFGTKPLNKMADLAGMKIRVSNDPVMRGLVKALDASPTVVNYNELYSALQTGVVDAAEQPIANYKSKAFNEVAPYMILDGHTLGAIQVIITDEAWNKLSANQQNALVEAGKLASAFNRELSEGAEQKVLKELAAAGATVVPVADKGPWQKACAGVIKEASAQNAALYQKILDMQ
ncbi:TRAP transporter substrate-binding protein [Pelobacter seleniigenes]|uniref:TRAP transporter substrate-binding protein n=1 Tax=Pelobacter seleniigenes TaxID=407188 RepID=UPI003CCBFF97